MDIIINKRIDNLLRLLSSGGIIKINQRFPIDFNTQDACAGTIASFIPTGMDMAAIPTWNWNFGDGGTSTESFPTHTYTSAGTYSVILHVTDTAGCSNTLSKSIVIAPLPVASFGFSSPTCQGDSVSFADMSTSASGFVVKWTWNFGDGITQTIAFPTPADVVHLYTQSGTFNVILTVQNSDSCTHQLMRVVTVLPKPTADFIHGAACQGNAVTFTDISTSNTTGTISGWEWDFGDPTTGTANTSILQHPNHI